MYILLSWGRVVCVHHCREEGSNEWNHGKLFVDRPTCTSLSPKGPLESGAETILALFYLFNQLLYANFSWNSHTAPILTGIYYRYRSEEIATSTCVFWCAAIRNNSIISTPCPFHKISFFAAKSWLERASWLRCMWIDLCIRQCIISSASSPAGKIIKENSSLYSSISILPLRSEVNDVCILEEDSRLLPEGCLTHSGRIDRAGAGDSGPGRARSDVQTQAWKSSSKPYSYCNISRQSSELLSTVW